MMNSSSIDLFDLKDKINQKKEELNKAKGKLDYLEKTLQETWKCKNIKDAQNKLDEMKNKIIKLRKSLDVGIKELEKKYGPELFDE